MNKLFLIRLLEDDEGGTSYRCALLPDPHFREWTFCADREALDAHHKTLTYDEAAVILPGQRVGATQVEMARSELRHMAELVPFQLEEELATSPDALHFVYSAPQRDTETGRYRINVYWLDRDWLEDHYSALADIGIFPSHCWRDVDLVPDPEDDHWRLQLEDSLWIRQQPGAGYAVDQDMAALVIEKICGRELAEGRTAPSGLTLVAADEERLKSLENLLPQALQTQTREFEKQGFAPATDDFQRAQDLATGRFAKLLPFSDWWQVWRPALVLAAVTLVVYVGVNAVDIWRIDSQKASVAQRIEATFREAVPQGAMVDPERQLQQKVGASGGGEASQFVPMMAAVAPVVGELAGTRITSMTYQDGRKEIRLNVEANNLSDVENLRSRLNEHGLNAELMSSTTTQNRHQAKLLLTRN